MRLRAFFHGKGRPLLYPILPPRGEIPRRDIEKLKLHIQREITANYRNYNDIISKCLFDTQDLATTDLRHRAFFRGKGMPLLYPILPPRVGISRGNIAVS